MWGGLLTGPIPLMLDDLNTPKNSPKSSNVVKSAGRVLEILELFDEVQAPMPLVEIARRLHYPAASALALLKSLQAMDYVSFDPLEKSYSPTMRVAMLGGWIRGQVFLDGAIVSLMNALVEQTGETVMLGMQNDVYAQYVHTEQSAKALRYFLKPGTLRPIWRSATGLALLSAQSDDQIRKLVKRINLRQEVSDEPVDEKKLLSDVAQVRRRGYAYNDQLTDGISAIAMLLPYQVHGRAVTIGIGGPTSRVKLHVPETVALIRSLISVNLQPTLHSG